MSKLLRCLAGLFILCFIGNAFAAGYNCPTYRKYTSCNSGYYISECDVSAYRNGELMQSYDLTAGNSCKACPSGYSCQGGLYCPDKSSVTCRPGYYLPANATSCSACGGNNYYCPGGTFNVSSSAQGRNTVLPGYYSTGGTSTTRTGQAQCTGATYCTGGVKYNCPTGYDDNTRNGKYRSLQCQINCSAGYYLKTARDSSCTAVGIGYYKGAHLVSYGSTSTRTACPTSYTTASTTSGTSINRCYLSVDGGYVRDGTDGTTLKRCFNGTYRGAHNEFYGTTYTCTSCPAYYSNSAAGSDEVTDCYRFVTEGKYIASQYATTETTCPAGYYCTGPAYYGGYGTNRGGLYICTGATYSTSGRGSCLSCPTGYDKNTQSGKTSASQCLLQLSPGQYIASAGDSTAETCLAGYYCPGDGVFYGGYGTNNGGMYICDGAVYSAAGAGACTACPTTTVSGWKQGTGTGWESENDCYFYRRATDISSYCAAGELRVTHGQPPDGQTPTAAIVDEYEAFQARPGAIVTGSGASMTCTQCGIGKYSAGGDVHACTACPALTPGFEYGTNTGLTSYTQCVRYTTNPGAVNSNCVSYDTAGYAAISQQAGSPTAWDGTTIALGIAAKPGAVLDSRFQDNALRVQGAYDFDDMCIPCTGNTYSAGGDATSCTSCNREYTISGTALTDHDEATDCKITCPGGRYVQTAGDGCVNVGAGYWAPSSTIPQGSVGSRNACASGLTTIGFDAGADEAGDCGRVLNVDDEKIYLRSTKKTTPSLNISINGDVFYGNMSTATKGSLRINSGGTTYSVYDDSM